MKTLAQTISSATLEHLQAGGLLFGQCLTAVGRVAGTIPDVPECLTPASAGGIVELPTCDVAGPGFVVGAALAGRRPIFVCRYQGFMTYNLSTIVNYAAKSKDMWGVPCPLFVRAIAMEGGIGPVASGSHHSMALRMPGVKVFAPMTPSEWLRCWGLFLDGDDPVYCSEHRLSYSITADFMSAPAACPPHVVLVGISAARLQIEAAVNLLAKEALVVAPHHLLKLRPLDLSAGLIADVKRLCPGGIALVVDSDYAKCGAAEHVAYRLSLDTGRPVMALGLAERTAGFAPSLDNKTPAAAAIAAHIIAHLRLT